MGLAWELHELIQDFVDGKLTPEREREVQAFLDRHPTAQQVADQYRMVTQPDLETIDSASLRAEQMADRVMATIPGRRWDSFLSQRWLWASLSTLGIIILSLYLFDLASVSQWAQSKLVGTLAGLGLISDSIDQISERIGDVGPTLIASFLIVAFWGTVDRLVRFTSRTNRA